MKMRFCHSLLAATIALTPALTMSAMDTIEFGKAPVMTASAPQEASMVIEGTGTSMPLSIKASNLSSPITLTATPGIEVFPDLIAPDAGDATVYVTLKSTLPLTTGQVILRSGDHRAYVNVTGYGTPLTQKDLSQSPAYAGGEDSKFSKTLADGFNPGENGYTVEFRVRIPKSINSFDAYAVTTEGAAFKTYVDQTGVGIYNGSSKISLPNPATAATGGKQQFYNDDDEFHTYRFAVTSDRRIFAYRDGMQIATLRADDYGHQPEWSISAGDIKENLLKNPGFEGEWDKRASDSLVNKIAGWIVDPIDRYNCTYEVPNYEINRVLDHDNHVLKLQRYNWNDGWAAGTVSQIVDVTPGQTYSLSFLAGGGMNKKTGEIMSSVKIQEVQDNTLGASVNVTNEEGMQPYGLNYTTSKACKQIKVIVYNERFLNGGGWGSSPAAFYVDEMALVGESRNLAQLVGFSNHKADVEYFNYDPTGAYAPLMPVLEPETKSVVIDGTGSSKSIKINIANLVSSSGVWATTTPGFSVMPEILPPNADGEVIVTLNSTLPETEGKLILRSGDKRVYVDLLGYGSKLEEKDLAETAIYKGGTDRTFSHRAEDGFTAGTDGFTVEFRAMLPKESASVDAYGVTTDGAAFRAYVEPEAIGFYNGDTKIGISNPATSATGGKGQFYNNDGEFHTYRFAVTSDGRVMAYRDGLEVGCVRAGDYGNYANWAVATGDIKENLLKNSNFEGETNVRSDNQMNKVEGWILDPIDQYNCAFSVPNYEINNSLDHDNHVMKLQRYNWNDGWAAGTVSQIVNVAPNTTYSLAFLAGGGMNKKTGEIMSSVKIQEVQDNTLGTSVNITNEEGLQPYGLNYTTSANCKQIKVVLHNERFLNGGGWGSSPQAFLVDQMTLTGPARTLDQLVGFRQSGAEVSYFAYDPAGAFAPAAPDFGPGFNGIDETAADFRAAVAVEDNGVVILNAEKNAAVAIYDTMGRCVARIEKYDGELIELGTSGIYIATITGNRKETLKFRF